MKNSINLTATKSVGIFSAANEGKGIKMRGNAVQLSQAQEVFLTFSTQIVQIPLAFPSFLVLNESDFFLCESAV
jgi:hypothetical protein